MTSFRLWIRRTRYWWDDAGHFSPSFGMSPVHHFFRDLTYFPPSLFVQFVAVFMYADNPLELSRLNRIAAYYLMATTIYAVIWTARLPILFSIIRIDPDPVMRRRLMWLATAFVATISLSLLGL